VEFQRAKKPSSFFVLVTFPYKKISIKLQKMQTFSILSRVVVVGLVISRLPPFQDAPPITMVDLEQVVDC
jgi:hypothetical protein